jgi:hypothetical protein
MSYDDGAPSATEERMTMTDGGMKSIYLLHGGSGYLSRTQNSSTSQFVEVDKPDLDRPS